MYSVLAAQNTTILFLRDGSIIQGTITHEKPNKIFLKTDMGFVQIKPEDIIGREDLAKKGDLTYMSDQIEFVRRHIENLAGRTVSWKDSLQNNINNLKSNVLTSLLNLKIKKLELDKYKVDINQIDANNHLSLISSNDISGLKEKFRSNNLDFDLFLAEIKTELAWRQLIFNIYNNKVIVDEKDIDFELSRIVKDKSFMEEFKLSEIEIYAENETTLENQINFILDQIQKIGFDRTAEKFSISSSSANKGDLGWINSRSFSKKIFKIVKNMQPGDISKPIRNPNSRSCFLEIVFVMINRVQTPASRFHLFLFWVARSCKGSDFEEPIHPSPFS